MANTLICLPPEIVHNILKYVDPIDLARVAGTCRMLRRSIAQDRLLCKEVWCLHLDEPKSASGIKNFDFEHELHEFVRVQSILTNDRSSVEDKVARLPTISSFTTRLLQAAAPKDSKNMKIMRQWFDDKRDKDKRDNIEAFLCQSTTYTRALLRPAASPPSFTSRQASAKLHVQYGTPIFHPRRGKFSEIYPYAVSMVYDLRNYKEESLWGPYLTDGRAGVDWEKMEAVMIVLGWNLRVFTEQREGGVFGPRSVWREPWVGASPGSYEGISGKGSQIPPQVESGVVDPYGIQGTWMRVVCFLEIDFHDLFAYNFTSEDELPSSSPRPPLNTTEAIRLISMELRAVRTEAPGPDDGQELPVVYFEGTAKSMHTQWDPNANSRVRGSVRLTREGEVRWRSVSVYGGEERWASEGIQVGGLKSSRGVLGHWFDKDHDVHGPAGPTAFWKVNDHLDDGADFDSEEEDDDWTEDPEEVLEAIASIVGFHADLG
ncbi:hypothetical protein N431DRAFT_323198 [Stipitochalara longipes BDJ]|nr:hypothetical protein N431DRAFT_323198 [Stipitochalara longipes BDJ]